MNAICNSYDWNSRVENNEVAKWILSQIMLIHAFICFYMALFARFKYRLAILICNIIWFFGCFFYRELRVESTIEHKIEKKLIYENIALTCVCVNPKLAANSARSGNARYCVRWNRRFNCCNCNELYMVRGLRIFLPFPFTRNPVSSHLSILKTNEKNNDNQTHHLKIHFNWND